MTNDYTQEFKELENVDTPTITNVVACYPERKDVCLGLYGPWQSNWYTNETMKCLFRELGPKIGYAVTIEYGPVTTNPGGASFDDFIRAMDASPKPIVVCIKQNFPDNIKNKVGLCGGNMATIMKKMGAVGVITDGPSRDVDEIREMGLQYMVTGLTAGHGSFTVNAVNTPIDLCGMSIAPGEVIHLDENGAVKFPASCVPEVLKRSKILLEREEKALERMRDAQSTEEIIEAWNAR